MPHFQRDGLFYIYVSGPITKGDTGMHCRNGILAAAELLEAGLRPFCPHASILWHMVAPAEYEDWIQYDLDWIERCDGLLRLPGESPGADREMEHALRLGLPVFSSVEEVINAHRNACELDHERD